MTDILEQLNKTRRGVMLVFGGPSGVGKSSVIKSMLSADKSINWSVSVTTRKPRAGEKDGVDYFFVSDEKYDEYLKNDAFYECVDSEYGSRYGTLREEIDKFINAGNDVIFDMDQDGLRQIKAKAPDDVVSVFLLPPSIEILRSRLENRHTDSREIIEKRMSMALERLKYWSDYDYNVVSLSVDQTVRKVQEILAAERMKRRRQPGLFKLMNSLVKEGKNG